MKEIIKIEDFSKIDLRVGDVLENKGDSLKIKCSEKVFTAKLGLDIKKGEQIIVAVNGDKLVIPVINQNIPLSPEKKIDSGSKVR